MPHKTIPLGRLCTIEKGLTGIMKAIAGPYPMVTLAEQRTSHNEYQFDAKAVIVPLISSTGHGHASMKRVHYQEGKFALGSILCALIPNDETELNARFLHNYLSFSKDSLLVPLMRGAANVSLSIKSIASVTIPLPSLDEQLTTNELVEVHSLKTKAFQTELNTQQTLLAQLRQAILQEAVQGKLTDKWRTEREGLESTETGGVLLARIRAEKAELIRQGKLRKEKPLPPITEAEKPFDLPEGWVWCRLGEVTNFIDYRGKTPNKIDKGIKLITAKNVKYGFFSYEPEEFISRKDYVSFMTRGIPNNGDILFTTEAPLGNACLLNIDEPFGLAQRIITIQPIGVSSEFLLNCILSVPMQKQLLDKSSGVTATGIKSSRLIEVLFPLPPLAEQQAIVAQVAHLLGQVSALESENKQQQAEVGRLMQAVLREAFAGKTAQPVESE